MTAGSPRATGEGGFAGGAEGLLFGCLLFVVGTLLAANAWAVVDAKLAADAASREAARTYVEAPDAAVATAEAVAAARAAIAGYGRAPGRSSTSVTGGGFGRCERITVTVAYAVPLVALPGIQAGRGEVVRAAHSEVVDPYRSGLPGVASCA
ncbi:MAG TPA: hypothetical protein VFP61_06820 [Acidimicrobiales bacterium]|nr:hypothetical protein [Acidimicrobiales bacterium]